MTQEAEFSYGLDMQGGATREAEGRWDEKVEAQGRRVDAIVPSRTRIRRLPERDCKREG